MAAESERQAEYASEAEHDGAAGYEEPEPYSHGGGGGGGGGERGSSAKVRAFSSISAATAARVAFAFL